MRFSISCASARSGRPSVGAASRAFTDQTIAERGLPSSPASIGRIANGPSG